MIWVGVAVASGAFAVGIVDLVMAHRARAGGHSNSAWHLLFGGLAFPLIGLGLVAGLVFTPRATMVGFLPGAALLIARVPTNWLLARRARQVH